MRWVPLGDAESASRIVISDYVDLGIYVWIPSNSNPTDEGTTYTEELKTSFHGSQRLLIPNTQEK